MSMHISPSPAESQRTLPTNGESLGGQMWPELPLRSWRATYRTLHLCTQIVGKIRLALTPKTNQWWNVPLYLTARGLSTSPMLWEGRSFEMEFDFLDHNLAVRDSDGHVSSLPLVSRSVAAFYREVFTMLRAIGINVSIRPVPVEIPHRTPLHEEVENATYVAEDARRFFDALRRVEPVFAEFRARFRGKCSPVHFFWGSFDLAVSRFSGRRAPPRSASSIERDAYDEEVISLGFWPGDAWGLCANGKEPVDAAFYSYTVPEPAGLAGGAIAPPEAYYSTDLREFLLPYEAVRTSSDPQALILEFAQSTYEAGASLAGWDQEALVYP